MLDLEIIKEKLSDRKLSVVSERTGINEKTLYNVLHEKHSPNYRTIKRLSDYLTENYSQVSAL